MVESQQKEETLDPKDWDMMENLAAQMAKDVVSYHKNIRDYPAFVVPTPQIIESLAEPLPIKPTKPEGVYREFKDKILSIHGAFTCHPTCWNSVMGTGTTFGALADMWMSGLNGMSSLDMSMSSYVELQVIAWIKEMLGYPAEASGVLTSGGSMANLLGLIVARDAKAGYDVKLEGSKGDLVFYGSNEMHYCIQKNLEAIGIGRKNLRKIHTDKDFKIDVGELRKQIEVDRKADLKPICVIGCAGSTNTGSIDDLETLSEICKEYDVWYHVDAAFGAWAAITPNYKHLVKGMEKSDSLAVDLHKWMYMPYGIGITLVRDAEAHYRSFREQADYVTHGRSLADLTLELSKPFRSLKAWMCLKEHGVEKYGRIIEQNILQAKYVEDRVNNDPRLELMTPVSMNVICFRYVGDGLDEEALDKGHEALKASWFMDPSEFFAGETVVDGKKCIRLCFTNHRTTKKDIDRMFEWYIETCKELYYR